MTVWKKDLCYNKWVKRGETIEKFKWLCAKPAMVEVHLFDIVTQIYRLIM